MGGSPGEMDEPPDTRHSERQEEGSSVLEAGSNGPPFTSTVRDPPSSTTTMTGPRRPGPRRGREGGHRPRLRLREAAFNEGDGAHHHAVVELAQGRWRGVDHQRRGVPGRRLGRPRRRGSAQSLSGTATDHEVTRRRRSSNVQRRCRRTAQRQSADGVDSTPATGRRSGRADRHARLMPRRRGPRPAKQRRARSG